MMWLSSDHTGGTADPEARVADGDVAVGKVVDEISHELIKLFAQWRARRGGSSWQRRWRASL